MLKEKLGRVVQAGWNNFRRNSYVTFGTTGVLALVLILMLGLIAVNFFGGVLVDALESKVDVSVYMKTNATDQDIQTIKRDLEKLNTVSGVVVVTRESALAEFRERRAQDTLIQESLAELQDNPLQASLNVKATDPGQYATIVSFLETHKLRPLMDKINYYENEALIERIQHISSTVRDWGALNTLLLAVIAVLVAFNTIRLTIINQKQEIEIMRLVGGSNWYIRAPYLVEGALYGIFAAILAIIIWYIGASAVSPKIALVMPGVSLIGYFFGNIIPIFILTVFVGIVLGMFSSFIAIRKFLRI